MDDYFSNLENYSPSAETATSDDIQIDSAAEIQQYKQIPPETKVEDASIQLMEGSIPGSYMLPKKVSVKTYKLKKI